MKPLELIEQGRFLGEEFLVWLWMRGTSEGGTSGREGDHSACFLDDSVMLAAEHGEVKNVTLSKGNPAESREAFEALARGMRPVKAKMRILSGDLEWVFTFQAVTFNLSALKVPPSSAKGEQDRASERLFLIEEGLGHLERRFGRFLDLRNQDPEGMLAQAHAWIRGGVQGDGGFGTGAAAPAMAER